METVEVLIRIPKDKYDEIMDMKSVLQVKPDLFRYSVAIANGKVLPKGHGELKDYDAIKSDYIHKMSVLMSDEERMDLLCTIVDEAEAIIEADKDGE